MSQFYTTYIVPIYSRIFPPKPPSPDEFNAIKKERDGFYADLKSFQDKVKQEEASSVISPDTSNQLTSLIADAQKWLRTNPNANSLEVKTERDDLTQKAKPIYERETAKNQYLHMLWYAESVFSIYNNDSSFKEGINNNVYKPSATQLSNFTKELANEFTWIRQNPSETALTYTQRIDTALQKYVKIFSDNKFLTPDLISSLSTQYKSSAFPYWWKTKAEIPIKAVASQNLEKSVYNNQRLITNSTILGLQIFGSLILVVLILFGGSLAANHAIMRDPIYKIFYFIFGCNPLLTPIIFAYTALLALKGRPIKYYGVLPISTEPAKTRLGKILWWPFYYEQDTAYAESVKKFVETLDTIGQAVKSTAEPAQLVV